MRVCYLLGHPVSHSMSAVMQNAAFKELDLDYVYKLRDVKPDELGECVNCLLREPQVRGANVTIPHKVSIIEFLDELDGDASIIGAVNTIVNKDGHLTGYNTDVTGVKRALGEKYGDLAGAKTVMIGAGGAAKAIGYHLSSSCKKLRILNRTPKRAAKLAEYLSGLAECSATVSASPLSRGNMAEALEDADILVNATPVGMIPGIDETPVDSDLLRPGLVVFDAVYNPLRTRLIREAEEAGATTVTGLSMLVYQGAEVFGLWTGRDAPENLMARAASEALGGAAR
ncbi:MAG: shikimate dehydrogenase [Candidatus Bathyarchaeota archaeon]|nr:MAG: shikimate dehydrogenase [Candidatus Bathyarchaeota archaeon]